MSDETITHACAPTVRTRRGMLGFALALTSLPRLASASPSSLMGTWRAFAATRVRYEQESREAQEAALFSRLHELEDQLLDAPIRSKDDVIAKLLMVGTSIDRGARNDERDQRELDACAAWVEAH